MTAPVAYTREQMNTYACALLSLASACGNCDGMGCETVYCGSCETYRTAAAMLRQAAAEGQGNERLLATVAELEVWNDAALKREDELRIQCASLVERVKELEARVAKRAAVTTATPTEPSKAAEGHGNWEARWQWLKRELKHRHDTEHIPARKAEQDSILAEMYAVELAATPTEPTPPPVVEDK